MRHKSAFTLIEMLVVIGVISILLLLLIPAVSAVRESARGTTCANNLKQLSLATLNYEQIFGTFPLGEMPGSVSPNVAILPFLEQTAIYNQFNFSTQRQKGRGSANLIPIWMDTGASTAVGTKLAVFVCPSEFLDTEPVNQGPNYWPSNYAWNSGTWWPLHRSWDGLFGRTLRESGSDNPAPDPPLGSVRMADCTDGLSHTMLLAEVACGPRTTTGPRTRVSDCYSVLGLNEDVTEWDALARCNIINWRNGGIPWGGKWRFKGYPWVEGTLWRGWYNTVRTPNQTCCVGDTSDNTSREWWFMMKPASAYHPGGVNCSMGDGSVKRCSETINRDTWMSLSTRSGSEAISGEF